LTIAGWLAACVSLAAIGWVVRGRLAPWADGLSTRIGRIDGQPASEFAFPIMTTSDEYDLLNQIRKAPTAAKRTELISDLEQVPIDIYPFHHRWLLINEVEPFACWNDAGYDHTRSTVPRDVQLLWAASYGKADIDNGGFHQFFTNWTGIFAPEMVEWFERAGLLDAARVTREALAVFGDDYSRSQEERQTFLDKFKVSEEDDWDRELDDPFYDLDRRFVSSEAFDKAADEWLRSVCGIQNLHDISPTNQVH